MKERLREALLFFLQHPSVTGEEKALCDHLAARITELSDWCTERVSNNLIVSRREPDVSRECLIFAGHLDTVPEPTGGLPVRTEGDLIYGRGASDMKAGDAVMLALLENFWWEGSWAEPTFVFYEREEGMYAENGLETVFRKYPWILNAELAFVLEPTENALEVGCVGTVHVEVIFNGLPAHSARPWQGRNALTMAGEFLAALHDRQPEKVIVNGLPFYEVLTPTMARGGRAKNVVPDEFRININHRFAPGKGLEDVKLLFDGLLKDHAASYEIVDFAPSGSVALDHPLVQLFVSDGLKVRPKQAWTDVARFAQRGVDAVNFGPGLPAQAHQRNEYAKLSLLLESYERLCTFFGSEF